MNSLLKVTSNVHLNVSQESTIHFCKLGLIFCFIYLYLAFPRWFQEMDGEPEGADWREEWLSAKWMFCLAFKTSNFKRIRLSIKTGPTPSGFPPQPSMPAKPRIPLTTLNEKRTLTLNVLWAFYWVINSHKHPIHLCQVLGKHYPS